ncbi:MAG: DUF1326 domain-containing protein [Armatimonadetes bacterium]|nr:DUF1326 domain-containing protein [Armatimonadota bacterium]MDE2207468.1 DUF1326 domain-containing protein [Armatimonadota bacterium]
MFTALFAAAMLPGLPARATRRPEWSVSGKLCEACTCSPPCTCNFGLAPGPYSYCWTMWSLDIRKGVYKGVQLDGLHLAACSASKGFLFFIDSAGSAAQRAALTSIARDIYNKLMQANGTKPVDAAAAAARVTVELAAITQSETGKDCHLHIGNFGGFDADYLMGLDGKKPVELVNNYNWNIKHNVKAKTDTFTYAGPNGDTFQYKGTNCNEGDFSWSSETKIYYR